MFLVSCCSCLSLIHWSQMLSREWRCSWSRTDRQCVYRKAGCIPAQFGCDTNIWPLELLGGYYRRTLTFLGLRKTIQPMVYQLKIDLHHKHVIMAHQCKQGFSPFTVCPYSCSRHTSQWANEKYWYGYGHLSRSVLALLSETSSDRFFLWRITYWCIYIYIYNRESRK